LKERDGGTLLTYTAAFKVGGKLAQVGSRLVVGATKKTADDFFGCLSRELAPGGPGEEAAEGAASAAGHSRLPLVAGLVVAGLLVWWFLVR
jgi:hypothetical protein